MENLRSINPYDGKQLGEFKLFSTQEIDKVLQRADKTFKELKDQSIEDRVVFLKNLATELMANKEKFATLMAQEMGKPLIQGIAEVEKCVWGCDFYAKNAVRFLSDELIETEAEESFISYDPIGCVLAVMPWNFPFWQVIRCAAPALTAGNTLILKHASNVPGCAMALQELFIRAG